MKNILTILAFIIFTGYIPSSDARVIASSTALGAASRGGVRTDRTYNINSRHCEVHKNEYEGHTLYVCRVPLDKPRPSHNRITPKPVYADDFQDRVEYFRQQEEKFKSRHIELKNKLDDVKLIK